MAGQKKQADGERPPRPPGGEEDPTLLALLGRLASVDPAGELGLRLSPAVVNRLLAVLVEQSLPSGYLVAGRDELDRVRERAYAEGWQDALRYAAHQGVHPVPAPETARSQPPSPSDDGRTPDADADAVPDDPAAQATVLAFPPRIPLVRAADTGRGQRELMPHRPRRRRRGGSGGGGLTGPARPVLPEQPRSDQRRPDQD
ncbi:hypothetical protein GCM10009665_09700 [Kitasatospora nipponensis]|uniref:Uncharacterized protein n=1 Tax=Kitasatospora nipponensis TaxID=258049 RepID=A0ABN1VW67_9ACTN